MNQKFAAFLILTLFLVTAAPLLSGEITIINKSGSAVTSVMITPSGSASWRWVSGGIGADQKTAFSFEDAASACIYDIRFTDAAGKVYFMSSVDLCESSEITLDGTKAEEITVKYFK